MTSAIPPDPPPTLAEAFPEGDVWRFSAGPLERVLVAALILGAGVTTVLVGQEPDVPARFLFVLGLAGFVDVVCGAGFLMRQLVFTPESFVERGLVRRVEVAWADVAQARLVPFVLVERGTAGIIGVAALIAGGLLTRNELQPHLQTEGNWVVALSTVVLACGTYFGVTRAWALLRRSRGKGGQGRVLVLRDASGRVLASLRAWPDRRTQDALEGVLRFAGIAFDRVDPDDPL